MSIWILLVFVVGGSIGGAFAARNENWFDVGLAGLLVGVALIVLWGRVAKRPTPSAFDPSQHALLLVDDDTAVLEVASMMLSGLGYAVDAVGRAEDALERHPEGAGVDLLVTDLRMPGMSGADLARTLRAARPDLRVLFMSGFFDPDEEDAWEGEPGVALLKKPFRRDALDAAVRDLLSG